MVTTMNALAPYAASAEKPWNYRRAAHLLRRTGIGAPREQVEALMAMTPAEAVASIIEEAVNRPLPPAPAWYGTAYPPQGPERRQFNDDNRDWRSELRNAWLDELQVGGLRERMALLWSNHFVTELIGGYNFAHFLYQYITLLRQHALGNFKQFVYDVGLNPAMLIYLDGNKNKNNGPNENYARELCELFTMGITSKSGEPNYTEDDIKEMSRALTGWIVRFDGYQPEFRPNRYDDTDKTIFGVTQNFDYHTLIPFLFKQRGESIAYHCCTELYKAFVYDTPDPVVIDELTTLFIESDFEIRPVMEALLASDHFFEDRFIGSKLKSPIEMVLGMTHELGLEMTTRDPLRKRFNQLNLMGQQIGNPPDVSGWPGHRDWLSTSSMPLRWDVARDIIHGRGNYDTYDPIPLAQSMPAPADPHELARDLADLLLPQSLDEKTYELLTDVLLAGIPDYEWSLDNDNAATHILDYLTFLTQLPEFQLT